MQILVIFELHLAEVMQHPASLWEKVAGPLIKHILHKVIPCYYHTSLTTGDYVDYVITYSGSHVSQFTAEQGEDVILQHELHLVFVYLFLHKTRKKKKVSFMRQSKQFTLAVVCRKRMQAEFR